MPSSVARGGAKVGNAEYLRQLRERARAEGKFAVCRARKAKTGRVTCQRCLARGRKFKESMRAAGRCEACGEPAAGPGRTFCEHHAELRRMHEARRRARCRKLGLCVTCTLPAEAGKRHCTEHLKANSARSSRVYRRRLDAGLCGLCGVASPERAACPPCAERSAKRWRERALRKRGG